jgi:DNA-binding SARP family transcriptional activator/tetratricopeptide (TPR) repeat protein
MNSDVLMVSLLGPPLVSLRGKTIEIRRKKVRFLFYYLAAQNQPVNREALVNLFWPDDSEVVGRKNLREALSNLRSSIPAMDFLSLRGDTISLNHEVVTSDIREFEKIVLQVRQNLDISQPGAFTEPVYLKIREAIALWRSPAFIPEVSSTDPDPFQSWVIEKGEAIDYWHQLMLEWMVDHSIVSGNLNEAVNWLSQTLLLDPLNTEYNIYMLNCLRDMQAYSELHHFCDRLEELYHSAHMPAVLRETVERVKEVANDPVLERSLVWKDLSKSEVHFTGRNNEMALLKKRLYNNGMVFVQGELGSGKSRLLKQFYLSLEVIPRLVYYQCLPGDEKIPYHALIEGMKKIISAAEWRELNPLFARALFPYFPELSDFRQDLKAEEFSNCLQLSHLLPETFYSLFTLLARQRKCLYVLDDAHWCDPESIDVLLFIHKKGGPEEIGTAIVAFCNQCAPEWLTNQLSSFAVERSIDFCSILPLTPEEIGELTFYQVGRKPSTEEKNWLLFESGGNPALLIGLLTQLRGSEDFLFYKDNFQLTDELRDRIKKLLHSLNPVQREILTAAAVMGEQFQVDQLRYLVDLPMKQFIQELGNLQQKQLLRTCRFTPQGEGLEFCHGLVLRYLEEEIPAQQKWLYHNRAVETLKSSGNFQIENLFSIARHLHLANRNVEAFDYWMEAGELAVRVGKPDLVNRAFGQALALADIVYEQCTDEAYYHLVRTWSDFAFDVGDMSAVVQIYQHARMVGQARRNPRIQGFAESGFALLQSLSGHHDFAMQSLEQCIAALAQAGEKEELVRSYGIRGVLKTLNGDFWGAQSDYQIVHRMFAESPHGEFQNMLLFSGAYEVLSLGLIGDTAQAKAVATEVLHWARLENRSNYVAITSAALACVQFIEGRFPEAQENLRYLEFERVGFGVDWWKMLMQVVEAWIYLDQGEVAMSWKLATDFIRANEQSPKARTGVSLAYGIMGNLYRYLEDYETAQKYYQRGLEFATNHFVATLCQLGLLSCAANGSSAEGDPHLEELLSRVKEQHYELLLLQFQVNQVLYELRQGRPVIPNPRIDDCLRQIPEQAGVGISDFLAILHDFSSPRRVGDDEVGSCKAFFEKATQYGVYWYELMLLEIWMEISTDKAERTELRRIHRRLLEQLRQSTNGGEISKTVRAFLRSPNRLLKV